MKLKVIFFIIFLYGINTLKSQSNENLMYLKDSIEYLLFQLNYCKAKSNYNEFNDKKNLIKISKQIIPKKYLYYGIISDDTLYFIAFYCKQIKAKDFNYNKEFGDYTYLDIDNLIFKNKEYEGYYTYKIFGEKNQEGWKTTKFDGTFDNFKNKNNSKINRVVNLLANYNFFDIENISENNQFWITIKKKIDKTKNSPPSSSFKR